MTTRDELVAIAEAFSKALADRDVDRLVGFYTEDARLLFSGMPVVRGRSEIEALFRSNDAPSYVRFENESILEGGDLVVDVGRVVTFGPSGPAGPVVDRGKYVGVYRRVGGELKIAVDAGNSDLPTLG
jgi:ketosteroid isomerase-like protein